MKGTLEFVGSTHFSVPFKSTRTVVLRLTTSGWQGQKAEPGLVLYRRRRVAAAPTFGVCPPGFTSITFQIFSRIVLIKTCYIKFLMVFPSNYSKIFDYAVKSKQKLQFDRKSNFQGLTIFLVKMLWLLYKRFDVKNPIFRIWKFYKFFDYFTKSKHTLQFDI